MSNRIVRGTVAAAAALAVAGASGTAAAGAADGPAAKAKVTTIRMAGKTEAGQKFTGPKTVATGSRLRIVNDTNPRKVGPHTFSLVRKALIPETQKEGRDCFKTGVCGTIAAAHKVDFQTGEVSKPLVDPGKPGWDKSFGKRGDSWFTEQKGEEYSAEVTAKPGSKLTYFCAIHPWMVDRIEVVKGN
ncbi:MAG: hypothetical protein U0R51_09360 [Solirubrobacterales bacterium]